MTRLLMPALLLTLASLCSAESLQRVDAQGVIRHGDAASAEGHTRKVAGENETRGMNFDVFIRLQNGMSEGELLLRAGKPDSEAVENLRGDIVKTYYYFPTNANPWITTITLRGGRVINLDRVKKIF